MSPGRFSNDELRLQAEGQEGDDVVVLRATGDGDEEALVILSLTNATEAELEKLYVPFIARGRGTASRALACAENYCRQRGVAVLFLWANPLDDHTDQEWLIGWYRRRGYVDADGGYAELQKVL
jgi:GNAT superfamily N-acetyltransferase